MRNLGAIVTLLALGGILLGAGYFAYQGISAGDAPLPGHFYLAMTLGIVFSAIVGIGLMALVFYSSRRGHDEPPSFEK